MKWTLQRPPLDVAMPAVSSLLGRLNAVRGHEAALRERGSGSDGVPLLVPPPAGRDPHTLMKAYGDTLEGDRDRALVGAIGSVADTIVNNTLVQVRKLKERREMLDEAAQHVTRHVAAAASGRLYQAGGPPSEPPPSLDHTWAAAEIDAKDKLLGRRSADDRQAHALNIAADLGGRAAAAGAHAAIQDSWGRAEKASLVRRHHQRSLDEAVRHAGLAAEQARTTTAAYAAWLVAPDGARSVDAARERAGQAVQASLDRAAVGLASATETKVPRPHVAANTVNRSIQSANVTRALAATPALAAELVREPGVSLGG
ncbi:hypothetical protein [Yinghuangia aomiensis]